MEANFDPHEVLGVPRDAGLRELRAAYCRLAVKCHPDNCPGNRREAAQQFRRLTKAYQTVAHSYGKRFSAADFARMDPRLGGFSSSSSSSSSARYRWGLPVVKHRRVQPRWNETRVFVYLWLLAMVLGLAGAVAMIGQGAADEGGVMGMLKIQAIAILIYVSVIIAAVVILPLTRKIIEMTVRLGFRLLPALTAKSSEERQSAIEDSSDDQTRVKS